MVEPRLRKQEFTDVLDRLRAKIGPGARSCVLARSGAALGRWTAIHALSETERPHIGPHCFDVGEALGSASPLSRIPPPGGILPRRRPDRVLLLVIHHNLVDRPVLLFVFGQVSSQHGGERGSAYSTVARGAPCSGGLTTAWRSRT